MRLSNCISLIYRWFRSDEVYCAVTYTPIYRSSMFGKIWTLGRVEFVTYTQDEGKPMRCALQLKLAKAVRIFFSILRALIQDTPICLDNRKKETPPLSEAIR